MVQGYRCKEAEDQSVHKMFVLPSCCLGLRVSVGLFKGVATWVCMLHFALDISAGSNGILYLQVQVSTI